MTSVHSAPSAVKSESQPLPKKVSVSSEATEKPLQICSPSAESRRPKWVPPGMVYLLIAQGQGLQKLVGFFFLVVNVTYEHFLILLCSLQTKVLSCCIHSSLIIPSYLNIWVIFSLL